MQWIRYNQELPEMWTFKRDIPKAWQHWAVKVRFLFCSSWIVRDERRRVYMRNGEWADTFDFHLVTPGHVIGLADMASADARDWSQEWRTAMADRRLEQCKLLAEHGPPR